MVTRDGTEIDSGAWNGEAITVNVDGLSIGSYTYICTVSDSLNHTTSDTIIVTATAAPTNTTTAASTGSPTPGFDLSYVLIAIAIALLSHWPLYMNNKGFCGCTVIFKKESIFILDLSGKLN